jgi:hypothetical protein
MEEIIKQAILSKDTLLEFYQNEIEGRKEVNEINIALYKLIVDQDQVSKMIYEHCYDHEENWITQIFSDFDLSKIGKDSIAPNAEAHFLWESKRMKELSGFAEFLKDRIFEFTISNKKMPEELSAKNKIGILFRLSLIEEFANRTSSIIEQGGAESYDIQRLSRIIGPMVDTTVDNTRKILQDTINNPEGANSAIKSNSKCSREVSIFLEKNDIIESTS